MRNRLRMLALMTLCALCLVMVGASITFLLYMKDTVRATGIVKSVDNLEIPSPTDGVITLIRKRQGDKVAKGEVLLEIRSDDYQRESLDVKRRIAEAKAEAKVSECKLDLIRRNPLPEKLWYVKLEKSLNEARKSKSESDLARAEKLFKNGIISEKSLRQIEIDCAKARSDYAKSLRVCALVDAGIAESIIKMAESDLNLKKTKLENLRGTLEELNDKIAACRLKAPHSGVVVAIPETIGRTVEKNDTLVALVWGKSKFIRAEVRENAIQDVRAGQRALCYSALYDKYRTGAFGGVVERVLSKVVDKPNGRFYEIDVKLIEEPKELRLGSTFDVQIVTGRKTIFHALTDNH
ncbi:MAG: HlyD family efflux transporter periplasmic adaptor subunit [Kiritimatiellaeota bacterium]|nr:HlyD family efflux transporter periplasmic adaptor subunit [Kiritimatiellota bacterium]